MNILQINAVHRHLSTGRNVMELNRVFEKSGHSCIAAFSSGILQDQAKEYKIGKPTGQKIHALLSRLTGLQGYFSTWSTKNFLKYMDEFHPDVVVLNNLHANYIHLPMLLKYLAKKDIPTVAVLHDCWFYTGKCCHYTVSGCDRWKKSCGNCPAKKKYNKSWFFDCTSKMLQDKKRGFQAIPRLGVIAVSDWLLHEAEKAPVFQNAVAKKRIYNWIDTQQFDIRDSSRMRQQLGLKDEKIILCVASSWDETKGLNVVQKIATGLEEKERMILVGTLPTGIRLPERVITVPKTDSVETLVALYNLADVFFQPSLEETFGKVMAEALCCGTPAVCFRSTACPELIGPGCGTVVEPGDVDGAFRELRNIMLAGKEKSSVACRAFATQQFSIEKNCTEYLEFCQDLIKGKGKEISL